MKDNSKNKNKIKYVVRAYTILNIDLSKKSEI